MRAQDYIFANVDGIDIMGEVLPQHDANGAWRPERGEDWAFLAEAYGERWLVQWMDDSPAPTQNEVAAKIAEMRDWSWAKHPKVPERAETGYLLGNLRGMLEPENRTWCAGVPQEKTLSSIGETDDWEDICPEIFPARQLGNGAGDWIRRWDVARLRAAFADLAANECYLCRNWYDRSRQTYVQEYSSGRQNTWPDWGAYFNWNGYAGTWEVGYPNAPTLTLPERAGTPALLVLFEVESDTVSWHLKVLQPNGVTKQLLMSLAGTLQQGQNVHVGTREIVMAVPMNLRTTLN